MILIDTQNRAALNEGKNFGVGYGFVMRKGNTFTTVQPISSCKDFLNDVVWSEATGKPYAIYGLNTKPLGIFSGRFAYMAIKALGYNSTTNQVPMGHTELCKYVEGLPASKNHILFRVEELLKLPRHTRFIPFKNDKNVLLAVIPKWWVSETHLISLWSLLVRCGQFTGDGDALFCLTNAQHNDTYMTKAAAVKIKALLDGKTLKPTVKDIVYPHGSGICSVQIK